MSAFDICLFTRSMAELFLSGIRKVYTSGTSMERTPRLRERKRESSSRRTRFATHRHMTSIKDKLSELGYSEVDYPRNEAWHKIFEPRTKLTDRSTLLLSN